MTEKLVQSVGLEVSTTGTVNVGTTTMIGDHHLRAAYQRSTIFDSSAWQENKNSLYTPTLIIIANMIVIIAESTVMVQVEELMASIDAGDNTLHISIDEPSNMKSAHVVVRPKAAKITVPEVPVTTLALRESATDFDPVLSGRISEMASALKDTVCTIIEMGSESWSAELAPAMDIMEELAFQMVQQFFVSMKSCIELVLSERSSFEFS